ncbi:choice-of-anchor L domain-containing protein, partial [Mesonia sp. K7]|uniref:choice-of-anchor L domain-containing protein n=1 Tax=Mesonia sp. K7 TaxID=2218606 RepID=UPI000DB3C011
MRNNYLIILFLFVSFISFGQGQDCATPITIPSIPFTDTDNTSNFGNNILGIPGATGCNSTSPTIFSGDEVVYHVNFPQDSPVNISVSNWSSQYGGVFIYEDCADIGVVCVAGSVNGTNTNTININSFLFTQNQDYYIVITSDAVQGNQTTDYTLNIVCDTPNPPTGNTVQDFCQGDTLADLTVIGTNITWYVNLPAGSANYFPVNPPTAYQLVDQEVYYATQTVNGCESGYFLVTANKTPPAPTVSSPQTFCSGDTLADLNISGTNLIWYSNTSGTNQIPNTTVLVNGTTYYVRDQVGGCLSDVVAVMVEQDPIPPVGDGQQVFCTGETVADLIVGGQNLTWYSDAAGTNVIANPSGVALTNGTTYYVSQTEGSCESDLLPIEAILITPPIGDATQGFCPNMTVSDLEVEGNDLVWYSDAAGTQVITDPSTTTLTNGTTYYVSQTYGPNCESALLAVTVNQLSTSQCNYISVDDTTYTTTQLVQDILIENPCAYTTDIQGITGVNFGNAANGIAYFKNYNPAFPIGSGLLLATGHAEAVEGPLSNVNFFPGGGWPADTQLSTYTNNLLSVTDTYHDATIVEFEFFPLSDQVSFNYVFSSNEYGTYQCGFSDPFAFFLEDPNGNVINMAKVPVTGDIVSVVTIRDQQYNPGCSSENITYFDKFYGASPGAPGLPGSSAPINVKGHTVKMLASATVVPLTNYKMKMVIQNRQDSSFDAAVFIEEGSFFIGFDLGPDLTFANGGVDCDDEDVEIGYTSSSSIATYQWYVYDSNFGEYIPLVGETNPMYTVTETGTYQLGINLGGDCESTDEIYVEIGTPPIVPTSPIEFFDCQQGGGSSGTATFDLTTQHANILNGQQNVSLTWYEDQIDADAGNANSIPTPTAYTNTTPYNQTIYVRMESQEIGNCYEVVPAIIVVGEAPDVPTPIANLEQCDDDTDGVMTFNLEDNEAAIVVNEPNPGDYTVTYHDSAINRTNGVAITTPTAYDNTSPTQTIYVRVENPDGCITDLTFDIIVYPLPTYNVPITYTLCDQGTQDGQTPFDLTISTTQIAGANTNLNITYYETASDADGDLPVNPIASPYTNTTPYNQTIYVRIVDINTGCYVVEPLDLEVVQTPVLTTPPVYELCDGDGDSQASFDLTTLDNQISTDPGLTFTYHATQADADSNSTSTIATPYQSSSTTIYVRAEYAGSGCYETVAVVLTVNPDPDVPATISDLELCDDDTDGIATFDLTDREGDITVNQPTGT